MAETAVIPSYMVAASNHSILNSSERSWTEAILDAPKSLALGLGAGVSEIANIPIAIGNFFGNTTDLIDYSKVLESYDADLSNYYKDHKLGIDTIGFITGSMVPGMAGVKVLNAGQTMLRSAIGNGTFASEGIGSALGLLAPDKTRNLAAAMSSIRSTGSVFKLSETNTLRALASGLGQSTLEAAAFETMVATTMYKSPILDDMSLSDITWNIALGTAIGGGLGGVFGGVGIARKISGAGRAAELELAPHSITSVPAQNVPISSKMLYRMNQVDSLPPLPTTGDLVERAARTQEATRTKLWLDIRNDFSELAAKDQGIAESMYQFSRTNGMEKNLTNYLDSVLIGRVGVNSAEEKALREITRKLSKKGILTDEENRFFADHQVSYTKLTGEGAGVSTAQHPGVTSLTDHMKDGEKFEMMKGDIGIKIGKKTFLNDNNPHTPFNIMGVGHQKVEARYWWAERLDKWVEDRVQPHQVNSTDIPLLEKAYRDGLERLSIIPEGKAIKEAKMLNSRQEIYDYMLDQKLTIAKRLMDAIPTQISVTEFIDKFKGLFGINFNVTEQANSYGLFQRLRGLKGASADNLSADMIALDKLSSLTLPMSKMMRTLKHEEGHRTFQALSEAQGITAANIETRWPLLYTEMRAIGKRLRADYYKNQESGLRAEGTSIGSIPKSGELDFFSTFSRKSMLIHEYFADTFYYMSLHPEALEKNPAIKQAIGHLITPIPQDVIDAISKRLVKTSPEEAAKIVNIEVKYLDGSGRREGGEFARDMARAEYKARMEAGNVRESEQLIDPLTLPSYAKTVSKNVHMEIDGNEIQGMAKVMQQTKLYDEASRRRATQILGAELPVLSDKEYLIASGQVGPGFASFAEGDYGSLKSIMQFVGQRTHEFIKQAKEATSELFTPTLQKLANNQDAAIEWSVLNERMRNLPQKYFLFVDPNGVRSLVYKGTQEDIADATMRNIPMKIAIKSELVQQLVSDHISRNNIRITNRGIIRAGEGLPDNLNPDSFYPIPRSPKDTPYFAFVLDDSITGTGHSKMIYAATDKELEFMKNQIKQQSPDLKVLTKKESEDYFKAHGEFEFERSLNENWINNEMARKGTGASYLPMTDPARIVTSFLEWHLARDASGVRDAVAHNYSRQFESLRKSTDESLTAATSKFGYYESLAGIEAAVDNPAMNMIKMALDVQKAEYPVWSTMNRILDQKVSAMWNKTSSLFDKATSPDDLAAIDASLKKAGYHGISHISEGMYQAMNGKIDRGVLTGFINKVNGLLATFALRADPLNALNNIIGQNVLLGTETASVVSAIQRGNKESAGELAALMKIKVPGSDSYIDSPAKLIAGAMQLSLDPKNKAWAKQHGFSTSITQQYDQTIDILSISGADTVTSLNKRLADAMIMVRKGGDTAELLTANRFAEEFNRTTAAFVMKQITDVAVKHGIMNETTALTYINTFVNRTQGNFLASQRPMLFQGPIGQAMGLFQTYQFNMIQQLMRHVGDGQTKNAAVMMGLQGVIYGINGLPGFNAINTHIIGNAAGNTDHTDLYRATYNAAGKDAGDWLMYGLGSNWMSVFSPDLKNNLYSRGDINPRNISVVPANPLDYPIVQATAKLASNFYESVSKVAQGADVWSTFLRGIEQNGISRPLAGMAQVLGGMTSEEGQVTPVNSKSNILMAHDWNNLASLTRVVGGKPLDEAVVNDLMFRFNAYSSHDAAKKASLGEAIKISILGGAVPDDMQIQSFSESYMKAGGKQENFVKFMAAQYKNASASQANQLRDKLAKPGVQNIQEVMGGLRLQDLSNNSELGAKQ